MDTVLALFSGIAWTIVYLDAIRLGFRDRTYAMPVAALALNIAWESTYAVQALSDRVSVQGVINAVWAVADVVIVVTYLRFGRRELPAGVTRPLFVGWNLLLFGTGFAVQWLFLAHFGAHDGARYSAFLQNLLMSGLFVAMFVNRGSLRGQSLTIAAAKWLGTLAPTILLGALDHNPFILAIGLLCSAFDLAYLGLVATATRRSAVSTARARDTHGA